jgi:hypothetical protein
MADDRLPSSARTHPLARVTGLALGLMLTVVYAQEADPFHRLSAREIRAQIIGKALCLTLKTRQQDTTTECYEVWRWKDHIEFRENGTTVMTGFVRKEWR